MQHGKKFAPIFWAQMQLSPAQKGRSGTRSFGPVRTPTLVSNASDAVCSQSSIVRAGITLRFFTIIGEVLLVFGTSAFTMDAIHSAGVEEICEAVVSTVALLVGIAMTYGSLFFQ